ncbi:MAG TPA: hypothetical protein VL654_11860 [Casimicrobiaceae bacterium]|nr:hypothetical protein [Casimicrobiaceae bacterium]
MTRNTTLHVLRSLSAIAFATAISGMPAAYAGGRGGGDSGDSSMNPFTGDSYAYFHGGRNLGEQGTIRPNRPNPAWTPGKPADADRAAANAARDAQDSPPAKRATADRASGR